MVSSGRRLMCVLAHPDDESLGTGGTLAKYAAEGVATYLVTATRGERGRFGDSKESPGPAIVGRTREAELRAAATELGLREVSFLDYEDGTLDQADPVEAIGKIASHLRRVRPHVVITFGPDGAYGHPDHIAVSQFTTAAIVAAADAHQVSKLYQMQWDEKKWAAYQTAFRDMKTTIDGVARLDAHDRARHRRRVAHGVARDRMSQDPDEHLQETREPFGRRPSRVVGHAGVLSRVQPRERRPAA
jgi:LmbE family N-acetylglucosaminyl deacetylase